MVERTRNETAPPSSRINGSSVSGSVRMMRSRSGCSRVTRSTARMPDSNARRGSVGRSRTTTASTMRSASRATAAATRSSLDRKCL
jgi:hypothetical protein